MIMDIKIYNKEIIEELFDITQEIEQVATGFVFTEGPAWDFKNNQLYFSDIPGNTLYRYKKNEGVKVYRKPSNYSNGLIIDNDGALVACEHNSRRVTKEKDGVLEVLADSFEGKKLNSPNDIIQTGDGSYIFNDPHYGFN